MCSAEEMFLKLLIRKGIASNVRGRANILYYGVKGGEKSKMQ